MRAEQHGAAVEVHPAGRTDSYRPDPVAFAQLLNQLNNHLFDRPGVTARRGPLGLGEDPALSVDDACRDLGAANVHPDGEALPAQPQMLPKSLGGRSGGRSRQHPAAPPGCSAVRAGLLSGCRCVHGSPSYSPELPRTGRTTGPSAGWPPVRAARPAAAAIKL